MSMINAQCQHCFAPVSDGEKAYILCPRLEPGMKVSAGDLLKSDRATLCSENVPVGMFIHNIELTPGKVPNWFRALGLAQLITNQRRQICHLQLPSKASLISWELPYNQPVSGEWKNRKIGKAGRKRLMGIRPAVRGTAQSWFTPRGDGEGRSPVGLKHPKTPGVTCRQQENPQAKPSQQQMDCRGR